MLNFETINYKLIEISEWLFQLKIKITKQKTSLLNVSIYTHLSFSNNKYWKYCTRQYRVIHITREEHLARKFMQVSYALQISGHYFQEICSKYNMNKSIIRGKQLMISLQILMAALFSFYDSIKEWG